MFQSNIIFNFFLRISWLTSKREHSVDILIDYKCVCMYVYICIRNPHMAATFLLHVINLQLLIIRLYLLLIKNYYYLFICCR